MTINNKEESHFREKVLALISGTSISLLIPILATPLLTRIYSPNELGIFASILVVITLFSIISSGRYEMAIFLPKNTRIAFYLANISLRRIILVFIFIAPITCVILFQQSNRSLLENLILSLIPLSISLSALILVFTQLIIRYERFRAINRIRITQSFSTTAFSILFGILSGSFVFLLIADLISKIITVTLIYRQDYKYKLIDKRVLKRIQSRYSKFSKYETFSSIISTLNFQLPILIIPIIFSASVAGFYFLVFRVIMSPVSVFGISIYEAFKIKATSDYRKNKNCREIFLKVLITLFLIGLFPTVIIMIYGVELFSFIFGSAWVSAGFYAQILAPTALARLISAPLSYMFHLREKSKLNTILQVFFLILTMISLFFGYIFNNIDLLVILLSLSGLSFYLIQISISYRLTKET